MIVTAVVLLAISGVKVYDLVVALTQGGPGIASEVPAKFVMDHLFNRSNIGLATAASTVMLVTVLIVLAPWLYMEHFRPQNGAGRRERWPPPPSTRRPAIREASGPKPQRLTAGRIGLYAFLVVSALFFLLPLYVMIVTSLKPMDEIRLGNIFNWPSAATDRSVVQGLVGGLHGAQLHRRAGRLLELRADPRAERDPVDPRRRAERLCAVALAAEGRQRAVRRPVTTATFPSSRKSGEWIERRRSDGAIRRTIGPEQIPQIGPGDPSRTCR